MRQDAIKWKATSMVYDIIEDVLSLLKGGALGLSTCCSLLVVGGLGQVCLHQDIARGRNLSASYTIIYIKGESFLRRLLLDKKRPDQGPPFYRPPPRTRLALIFCFLSFLVIITVEPQIIVRLKYTI